MNSSGLGVLVVSVAIILVACSSDDTNQPVVVPPLEVIQVDSILSNGKIVTVDEEFSIHNVVVVDDGRIVETGDQSLLGKYQATTEIDLQGKTVLPGFIDSHTHIRGRPERYIELSEVSSIAEIQALIRAKAEE